LGKIEIALLSKLARMTSGGLVAVQVGDGDRRDRLEHEEVDGRLEHGATQVPQDRQTPRASAAHEQVEPVVPVEVPDGHSTRVVLDHERRAESERSVPRAEEQLEGGIPPALGDIGGAVSVQIADGQRPVDGHRIVVLDGEEPATLVAQHDQVARSRVLGRREELGRTVHVEVAGHDVMQPSDRGMEDRRLEVPQSRVAQHGQGRRVPVRHGEIHGPIDVHVGRRDVERESARGVGLCRGERAVPVVVEHGQEIGEGVRGGEVLVAVSVQVGGREAVPVLRAACGVGALSEGPVPFVGQHENGPVAGHRQDVQGSVAVEVREAQPHHGDADGEVRRRSEGTASEALEHAQLARVREDEIGVSVAVHVIRDDALGRLREPRDGDERCEGAAAVVEQERGSAVAVRNRDVRVAIGVQVL